MSQVALRLPDSLHQYAKQMAARDDASLNQFIVTAVAEKISALNTEAFFWSGPDKAPRNAPRRRWPKCARRRRKAGMLGAKLAWQKRCPITQYFAQIRIFFA